MKKLKDILEFVSKDTIYEKLDINNVNLKSNSKLDLSYDKIIELLEYKKFKQKPYEIRPFIYDDVAAFNDYNGKYFEVVEGDKYTIPGITFADTSKKDISENNPLFNIEWKGNKTEIVRMRTCIGDSFKTAGTLIFRKSEYEEVLKDYFDL